MNIGIYTLTCLINNKIYVGYTVNFDKRKEEHFRKLTENKHKNIHLQSSFNKYGREKFVFEVLEECEKDFLASQEHYWATLLNVHNKDFGYNIRPTHPYGKTINTPEIRNKISKSNMGKIPNWGEEYKKSRKERMIKRGWTKEEIEKRASKKRIPVVCLSLLGEFKKEYSSAREASKDLKLDYKLISMNCKKKCKRVKNNIFLFKKDYDNSINYSYKNNIKG